MKHLRLALALLLLAASAACSEKDTAVGANLADPETLYQGIADTLYPDAAYSKIEDTLRTSNYPDGILGNITDPVFGKASSVLFTQIALPTNAGSIDFNEAQVDSVVLTLVKKQMYPDTTGTYSLRFEVRLLAEALLSDTIYYSNSQLPVTNNAPLFDQTVSVSYTDTVVRLKLDPAINDILRTTATADDFIQHTKGLRIRISEGQGMMSVDFSNRRTCLTAYYHNTSGSTVVNSTYTFLIGHGAAHFTQFTHDYSGTALASTDTIKGNNRLYMEALGGYTIHMAFDRDIRAFRQQHPRAVIHYAELQLPLAPEASTMPPDMILAMTQGTTGNWIGVADLYTTNRFDGTYDNKNNRFRIRLPRHLQQMLRQGCDPGMLLLLDSRRHTANNTVIHGTADPSTSPKIIFVYSE